MAALHRRGIEFLLQILWKFFAPAAARFFLFLPSLWRAVFIYDIRYCRHPGELCKGAGTRDRYDLGGSQFSAAVERNFFCCCWGPTNWTCNNPICHLKDLITVVQKLVQISNLKPFFFWGGKWSSRSSLDKFPDAGRRFHTVVCI